MQGLKEFYKSYGLSIALSGAIVSTILSIYTPLIPLISLGVLCIASLLFMLCSKIHQQIWSKSLLLMVSLLLVCFTLAMNYLFKIESFLAVINKNQINWPTFILLALWGSFFIAACVYYFTQVRFRSVMLILLILIPSTLYAKQLKPVPLTYIILLILAFFSVMITCNRQSFAWGENALQLKARGRPMLFLLVLIVLSLLFIPIPVETPFDYFRRTPDFSAYDNLGSYSEESGDSRTPSEERLVMRVMASESLYLKNQVFGAYNGKKWKARKLDVSPFDQAKYIDYDIKSLAKLILEAGKLDGELAQKYGLDMTALEGVAVTAKEIKVEYIDYPSYFISHPPFTYGITELGTDEAPVTTADGELFLPQEAISPQASFALAYYSTSPKNEYAFAQLFSALDLERYKALLEELQNILKDNAEAQRLLALYSQDNSNAASYRAYTSDNIPATMKTLAGEITKDSANDLEKAAALEAYFHNPANGFVYDLKYLAPEEYQDNSEYFLFTSKTGTCTDYATAMTLLGRSAGLTIRYVEGFYTGLPDAPGRYDVTTYDSHAYVEVFVSGYGWMTFEPTVAYVKETEAPKEESKRNWGNDEIMALSLGSLLGVVILILIIRRWILPVGKELFFRFRVRRRPDLRGITLLYQKTLTILSHYQEESLHHFTPQQLLDYADENLRINLRPLVNSYEGAVFAAEFLDRLAFKEAYKVYKKVWRICGHKRKGRKKSSYL